jgi:hypothetical protein
VRLETCVEAVGWAGREGRRGQERAGEGRRGQERAGEGRGGGKGRARGKRRNYKSVGQMRLNKRLGQIGKAIPSGGDLLQTLLGTL